MSEIIIYALIGILWAVVMERFQEKGKLDLEVWGFRERIVSVVLWPLLLTIFISTFTFLIIKSIINYFKSKF
jgi:hypothetical protein